MPPSTAAPCTGAAASRPRAPRRSGRGSRCCARRWPPSDDAALTRAAGTSASDLATLVPEIKERLPGTLPPSAADPAEARFRLVDAISRCVCAAATERPVLLALEDLHWADVPSLDVVRLLAATLQGTPLLAIATYRDTVAERGAPLSAALPTLVREPAVTHLPLHGLSPDAVATLARTVLGHDPQPALVEDLHERTEGNPFYATQLLSLVTDEGTLPAEVPASVREVVQRRAGALPPATREALEAAAVIGRDFDLPTLAATCGQARADLLDALDAAVQAGLVLTTEHPQRYRFEHLLARDALYAALPPGRRARLHAAVGEALDDDPARVAEVAHHYELAAPLGLTERAIDTAFRAADRAESVFAFESVEQHLRQVVRLADADPQRELQAQARLVRLLVATQGYAGPGVRPAALRARELADRVGDVAMITLVRWGLALDACVRRGFAESQALGEEQIAASRAAGDAVGLAVGLQQTGTTLWHQGRLAEAVEHLRAAAERFREVGVEAWRARGVTYSGMLASGHLALALSAVGPYEEARTVRDATLAAGRETGEAFELVSALNVFPMWGMFTLEEETARLHGAELQSMLEHHAFPAIRAFAAHRVRLAGRPGRRPRRRRAHGGRRRGARPARRHDAAAAVAGRQGRRARGPGPRPRGAGRLRRRAGGRRGQRGAPRDPRAAAPPRPARGPPGRGPRPLARARRSRSRRSRARATSPPGPRPTSPGPRHEGR